jgi:hypothetical protein
MTEEEANKIVDQHIDAMMEHFESVHVLATYITDGGDFTMGISRGAGNFYARKGMFSEWSERQLAEQIANEIGRRQ